MPTKEERAAFYDFRAEAHRLFNPDDLPTEDELEALQTFIAADIGKRYAAAIRDRAAEAYDY